MLVLYLQPHPMNERQSWAKLGKAHPNNYAKQNFKYKYIIGHIIPEQALNLINLPPFFDPAGS